MKFARVTAIFAALACCEMRPLGAFAQTYAEHIATGFGQPLFGTAAPSDPSRLFVASTWMGRVDVLDLTTRTKLPAPFLDVSADLPNPLSSEQGILGMAFDPDYLTNGFVYVDYTRPDSSIEVRRFRVNGNPATSNSVDPSSGHTIINIPRSFYWHYGGWIDFSPRDGYLYINVGDPGGGHAQIITNDLDGKVLRLDVRTDAFPLDPSRNYAIPPTNPLVGKEGDDEIWAYGLRNPWRASFDRATGDLWINDTGQNSREEVNYQHAESTGGQNYGWPYREGTLTINQPGNPPPVLTEPAYDYSHNNPDPLYQGSVVTASSLYRGPVAALQGFYLFTDFGSRNIWSLDPDAVDMRASVRNINSILQPDLGTIRGIASFGEDSLGNVYLMEYDVPDQGEVWKIASHSQVAVWNGNSASAGVSGDGANWAGANNWMRGPNIDAAPIDQDLVIFSPGSSHSTIRLNANRLVSAVIFSASYTLNGDKLTVLSGNVTVTAGITAVINSDLAAQSLNHSIRKLGTGRLLVNGTVGQVAVKEGTLSGSGTLDYLTALNGAIVAPGNSAGIMRVLNDFKMHSGATLSIDIGGRDNSDLQNPQFDILVIEGAARLAGTLSVELIDLGNLVYSPVAGDSFTILTASDGIIGTFDAVRLPALQPGLIWEQAVREDAFILKVARFPGDYDQNGVVDAADYLVWRKTLGQTGTGLAADGNGNNQIDPSDYDVWRAHYGHTTGSGLSAIANAAVPEPSTLVLSILMAAGWCIRRSRAALKVPTTR